MDRMIHILLIESITVKVDTTYERSLSTRVFSSWYIPEINLELLYLTHWRCESVYVGQASSGWDRSPISNIYIFLRWLYDSGIWMGEIPWGCSNSFINVYLKDMMVEFLRDSNFSSLGAERKSGRSI